MHSAADFIFFFIYSPMNFYVFPDRGADVVMSPGAIDFLRKNGLDFGKWISKGLPFAGVYLFHACNFHHQP
jgi:hypothetical protein